MNDVLKTAMIRYYDFMTAYQNLLRDKDTEAEISVSLNCTDAARNLSLNAWPPQKSAITVYAKNVNGRQVIHLLNFLNADNLSWRDLNGTMPEPRLVSVGIFDSAHRRKLYKCRSRADRKLSRVHCNNPIHRNIRYSWEYIRY